jgi:hypothetical protein
LLPAIVLEYILLLFFAGGGNEDPDPNPPADPPEDPVEPEPPGEIIPVPPFG